jgi:hypothetical protein
MMQWIYKLEIERIYGYSEEKEIEENIASRTDERGAHSGAVMSWRGDLKSMRPRHALIGPITNSAA